MNILNLSELFFAFGTFFVGIIVYIKRQDEVGRKWFLFSLSASIWAFFLSLWANQFADQDTSLVWMRMSHLGSVFIPPTWLDFIYSFLGIGGRRKIRVLFLARTLSFVLAPLILTSLFLKEPRPFPYYFAYYPSPGPLYHIFTLMFFSCVTYAFVKTIQQYRLSVGEKRRQIKYLIWGTGVGFLGGSLTFSPVYGIDFPQYNLLIMPLYPFIMIYALIRYHLLDLEEIAQIAQRDKLASLGILATSINHEIRNPLYVIKGLAESYLANVKDGIYPSEKIMAQKSNEIFSTAIDQAQRALEIMKRFSLFAKQGARETAELEEVPLKETFEGILPLVRHELELDKIELVNEIPADLSPILADRRHIEEIFFNLLVNACQAMREGGELKIKACQRHGHISVTVQDNGPGIPLDQLPRIFEPFYTTKESGTGLGLYITKQLVERNKGRITVESQLNQGTRFILEFSVGSGR